VRRQAVASDRQRVERRFKAAQDESELRYGSAQAAGVYVGIGLPVPIMGPAAPAYYPYAPGPYVGLGYVGPGLWGYGYRGYYRYAHPGYFYRGAFGFHRR
jgi:hypothetical protein